MNEKNIAEMKWNEIPADTPMYEILQSIGFPEPMVILKHLNKEPKSKKAKKPDLSTIITFLWMSKDDFHEVLESMYYSVAGNSMVRQYLTTHPAQALLLIKTIQQVKEEPLSVVAKRNMNEWRKLFIEEDMWHTLMSETPLTLIDKVMKMFTETDYLNMTLGEYFAKYEAEATLEKVSIKAIGDKIVEAEEEERRKKELEAQLKAAGFGGDFNSLLKAAMRIRANGFDPSGKPTGI